MLEEISIDNNGEVFLENNEVNAKPGSQNLTTVKYQITNPPKNSVFDASIFNKLPNPTERYLSSTKITNGLNIGELLLFIIVILKMKRETQITDDQICELLIRYCLSPLLEKVLTLYICN